VWSISHGSSHGEWWKWARCVAAAQWSVLDSVRGAWAVRPGSFLQRDDREAKYSGFSTRDQETKYNLTLFDLVMTLSARVTASLKLLSPLSYKQNYMEVKVGEHIGKLL